MMNDMRGPKPAHAMAHAVKYVVEQVLRYEKNGDGQPAGLPGDETEVSVDIGVDRHAGKPRELARTLMHQREGGVAERGAPAVDARCGPRAREVPRLPADACEKYGRHGDKEQFGIE